MRLPAAIVKNESSWRRLAVAIGIGLLLIWTVRGVTRADDGDFKVHWETGRRFLAGEFIYAGGHDFPYPPLLGLILAPAALMPMPIAKAAVYPIGVAALLLLIWLMYHLVRTAFGLTENQAFWTAALAVFLCIQFILRDQAEVGVNTAVAAAIWLGIYFWTRRRDVLAGTSLGLAIAVKCTPAIFIAYFLWKRQWRVAICAATAALFFTVLPILWQGPASWSQHMTAWAGNAFHGISATGSDYTASEMSRTKNMSLRPSLTSYLTRVPEISRRSWDPPPIEFLTLPPTMAKWIVNAALIAILGTFIWCSRGRITARDDPRILWELAATGILMLLFSPITWSQHCVGLLPACFLISAVIVLRDNLPGWVIVILSAYALVCAVLARDLIGKTLAYWLNASHLPTLCILGLLAVVLAGPRLQQVR